MQSPITREELGRRLYMIRHERRLTQEEFGDPIGLGKTGVCKLEKGLQCLDFLDAATLASVHRFCLNALFSPVWDFTACLLPCEKPQDEATG